MEYIQIKEKKCYKCGLIYPGTTQYFHRNRTREDGLQANCKICMNRMSAINRKRGPKKKEKKVINGPIRVEDLADSYELGTKYLVKIRKVNGKIEKKFTGELIQEAERFITLKNPRGIIESFLKIDLLGENIEVTE